MASRLIDWFWLRSAERVARSQSGTPSPRALELIGRAALASDVAARTERPAEPFPSGGAEAVAAELYREAIHWSLLAHAEIARSGSDAGDAGASDLGLDDLFARADRSLLERAAGSPERVERLSTDVRGSYRTFAELEPSARRELVERLERASQALLEPLASFQRQLERIWVRRVLHVLAVFSVVGGVAFVVQQLQRAEERHHDYAARSPWTLSSRYPQGGCESPKQECVGGENYFFHTQQEQDPSVTFDLGRDHRVSTVEVDNRLDCCGERAVPLAISVSSDNKTWREVARRTTEFTTLRESFGPVRARYVKIHIPAPLAILHLSRVRIYP